MIDEKKIQEAAYEYAGNGLNNAFIQGIEWFKKNIWHSIHEEPQMGKKSLLNGGMLRMMCVMKLTIPHTSQIGETTVMRMTSWHGAMCRIFYYNYYELWQNQTVK